MRAETVTIGSWRELLGPRYLGASTVLAGGVALYATNEFLTISLLPSAVNDIGGGRLYAWVTTVYLVASVMAATTVSGMVARFDITDAKRDLGWAPVADPAVFQARAVDVQRPDRPPPE